MERSHAKCDVAVIGGGIAGLWTAALLRNSGYGVIVITPDFGGGQTIASQGIIHGGVKYALGGLAGDDSAAIAEMPERWRRALAGEGPVDLRGAHTLSENCLLWTRPGRGARLMAAAAARTIREKPRKLEPAHRPPPFDMAPGGVEVYALSEPVLAAHSVLLALRAGLTCLVCPDEAGAIELSLESGRVHTVRVRAPQHHLDVRAAAIVLAAGAANETLFQAVKAGRERAMQRRPLHMVMVRGRLPRVYGHCIGMHPRPLATITSTADSQKRCVWYIGGQIAEDGVSMSSSDLIAKAKHEMAQNLPWISLDGTQWATWRVDRAEARMPGQRKPDGPAILNRGNLLAGWPTKLAFAPLIAEQLLDHIRQLRVEPTGTATVPDGAPPPEIAPYPWDQPEVIWT
ncbi:MAG: FAD-dependent oxidoreductase [Phycisphaeraceae bacterium]|nr:FAD-dependent oxidoreductase [Phycisphaeraceae bacterium]MCW5753693.1 FAD-dependent oxidoreductase [Phycisphaeraceae bacterium]